MLNCDLKIKIPVSLHFTAVSQEYTTETHNTYVIVGNSALVKCEIPSFVGDFVMVESWVDNDNNHYYKNSDPNGKKVAKILSSLIVP